MIQITEDQARRIMPHVSPLRLRTHLPAINAALAEFEIGEAPIRVAAFIAQIAHETCELRYSEEIASGDAYEGRDDLGNTQPGDGRRYKGRGAFELTGRANYRKAGAFLGLDLEAHPELAEAVETEFRIAGWYWKTHGCNLLADAGKFDAITRAINGGFNGKAQRDAYYATARKVLGC